MAGQASRILIRSGSWWISKHLRMLVQHDIELLMQDRSPIGLKLPLKLRSKFLFVCSCALPFTGSCTVHLPNPTDLIDIK